MRNTNLQAMIESAILAAFAMIIDILPLSLKLPTGGSISFAMIPIFIIAYRWGFKSAFLGGLVWGLLQIVVGDAYILTPVQAFIEYFIAFAFIGFAGLFYRPIQKALLTSNENNLEQSSLGSRKEKPSSKQNEGKKVLAYIILATFIGSFARYFCHFIAGIIFWGQYAPKGQSAVLYSLIVNGSTMLGSFILCTVLLIFLFLTSPRLFKSISAYQMNTQKKGA
ncbi:energy-coupled thiamine transporter ThiT [Bacillus cereus]|uniref:Energy-coupled thiamine transporter ThiT n=2 Tax=Bacillus cereus group TaxID=86661 RepID=A0A2B1CTG8_BACCE|nr:MULTISPECIES: energy-coupled thiamine transporter ThiT [Bacillus cereus group]ALQ70375.1 energy-coupled thiamine transporter ThiT [Bacillus thuringiensis]OUA05265.1 energy-coupled thiamine transporter ThiT [Bacillus thuringiensis serovar finitimus]PEC85183.1 energy-coupled thiamine transporter ThiT [Bacillus cereus]PEQ46785.1 energy-coupled thiamine transporter ThiT [Bacillus cereus]PEX32636.1 energy-coupled thiamine transporter ThiT [Bacillus cereus]